MAEGRAGQRGESTLGPTLGSRGLGAHEQMTRQAVDGMVRTLLGVLQTSLG
jgi:hypothetical protein